jgi:hypothetical protein
MTNFRIGELDVCCVTDGILKTSVDFILGMEREEALRISGAEPDGTLPIPVNNFVFRRDGATMLIDAGAGNTMQPTLGRLPDELRKAGHAPEAITHVILTQARLCSRTRNCSSTRTSMTSGCDRTTGPRLLPCSARGPATRSISRPTKGASA